MTDQNDPDDCVSKKPWSEVLNRSLKLFVFNSSKEGGKSFGKVIFYIILTLVLIAGATYLLNYMTGWFSGWFDFWPFSSSPEPTATEPGWKDWFSRGEAQDVESVPVEAPVEDGSDENGSGEAWYCKWNPVC